MRAALKRRSIGCIWLGITDLAHEGTYTYHSDESLVSQDVKSLFWRGNTCGQNGLPVRGTPGRKDCDHLYFCKSSGIAYTSSGSDTISTRVVCEQGTIKSPPNSPRNYQNYDYGPATSAN